MAIRKEDIAEFAKVFDLIPNSTTSKPRGPVQDESLYCDPQDAAVMRAIERGQRKEAKRGQ